MTSATLADWQWNDASKRHLQGAANRATALEAVPTNRHAPAELQILLVAIAEGDRSAFEKLYRVTSARLFATARRFVRQHQRAEEILQECYITVWNNAASYDPARSAPMTWLVTIVRNRCLDALRIPVRELAPALDDEDGDPFERFETHEPGPLQRCSAAEDEKVVRDAMDRLPQQYRQALTLAYAHGCAHGELAARLQIPLGTAKSWVRRGLEALRSDVMTRGHTR